MLSLQFLFTAFVVVIAPMEWGKNTYIILRLPKKAVVILPKGTKRVEDESGDVPVNSALTKAPAIDGVFVYTGKTFLRDSGLTVGEPLVARIRAADPDLVEFPEDVTAALHTAGRSAAGQRRGKLHLVNTAKRADTRDKRIAKPIAEL